MMTAQKWTNLEAVACPTMSRENGAAIYEVTHNNLRRVLRRFDTLEEARIVADHARQWTGYPSTVAERRRAIGDIARKLAAL